MQSSRWGFAQQVVEGIPARAEELSPGVEEGAEVVRRAHREACAIGQDQYVEAVVIEFACVGKLGAGQEGRGKAGALEDGGQVIRG